MQQRHSIARLFSGLILATLPAVAFAQAQPTPTARPLMKDFMGINAHTVQFKPDLFSPVCRLVRDYHPIEWDTLGDTSADTQFPLAKQTINWNDPSGKWKSFSAVPNWQEIYSSWQKAGFEIDPCIQFDGVALAKWKNPAEDAYKYGKAFAEYFGPSGQAKLITSAEIGNEPAAGWKPAQYKIIFENMAKGLRAGDPKLKILTATTQGGHADNWSLPTDTFKGLDALYDVLNVHVYSFKPGTTAKRSFPEDPKIEYLKIVQRTIDWRNQNSPAKEVWITEFGYDASTKVPTPAQEPRWVCVSDTTQAQWIVRSFLEFSAMSVDRAYLYWFNDEDTPTMHASSGITRFLNPKPSYWAMKHLYATLGDYRFAKAVEKATENCYVYEYVRDGNDKDRVWVIWSPTGSAKEFTRKFDFPGKVVKAERMPLADGPAETVDVTNLKVTESPVYVWLTLP